ncbi:MAG: nucleotide disphospho-sugar-binding domain-containing protein [Arenimonas sp.]
MARILFAWELGGGLGHLHRFLPVARALAQRGHQVFIAARELHKIQQVARPGDPFIWFQSPIWLPAVRESNVGRTYCDLLFHCGFLDPSGLLGLVRGWHALFAAVQPDLLICDHAPISLLSVRNTSIKRMTLGNGFFHPPALAPLPSFRLWEEPNPALDRQSEDRALYTSNAVLKTIGAKPMAHMHELFEVEACLISSRQELDHYQNRTGNRHHYLGEMAEGGFGSQPVWNDTNANEKKIFAYLKNEYTNINELLKILSQGPHNVLAYVSNIDPELITQYSSSHLAFSTQSVQMGAVLEKADLLICHAGSGTLSSCLMAGVPSLSLPIFAEQRISGMRVEALGCGLSVQTGEFSSAYEGAVQYLLESETCRENLRSYREKYFSNIKSDAIGHVVTVCENILAGTIRQ